MERASERAEGDAPVHAGLDALRGGEEGERGRGVGEHRGGARWGGWRAREEEEAASRRRGRARRGQEGKADDLSHLFRNINRRELQHGTPAVHTHQPLSPTRLERPHQPGPRVPLQLERRDAQSPPSF